MKNTQAAEILPDNIKRDSKVSKILITQSRPTDEKSPFFTMAGKYNIHIDFSAFIKIDFLDYKEFRKQKIEILDHSAIILTSRNAVDHFFKLCSEAKLEMPPEMKYFCVSEQTANYLQKYITIRKRKIFTGEKTASDLFEILKKHKAEKFLFPCSNIRNDELPVFLRSNEFTFTEAVIYKTVSSNVTNLDIHSYDLLAFFSPSGVTSLLENFPEYVQKDTRIAAFGPTTSRAVKEAGLILDIEAPIPNAPSMAGAIEVYLKKIEN